MAISSSGSGSSQSSAFSQPTLMPILDDPRLGDLFNQIQGVTPRSLPSLDSLVQEGMNSPLLSQIISGALTRAKPNEALARQSVTDAARATGGLRGTAYMQGVARNEGNILDQRGILTSDIIAKTLQSLISGRLQEQQNSFLPARTLTDLLQAGRPLSGQISSSQSTSQFGNQSSGTDDMLNSWLNTYRNASNPPNYAPGFAGTDVNAGQRAGSNIASAAPNPYGGYGFNQGGAPTYATGGSPYGDYNWTTNQGGNTNPQIQAGPWQPYGSPNPSWAGRPPQQDRYGYTPQQWNQDPYYNPPAYDNPYAGWQPAEPVPWVSEGGEY